MSEVVAKSMSLIDKWHPYAKGRRVSSLYGLSIFGTYLSERTGIGYKRQTLDPINPMMLPLIELFREDDMNRYFFSEIGSMFVTTPYKTRKLLAEGGAFSRVLQVHEKPILIGKTVQCEDVWVEWESFPRVLEKRRISCPLIERAPVGDLTLPPYLFRNKRAAIALFVALTLPVRYDYRVTNAKVGKEIIVDYTHPVWGRLRSEVLNDVLRGISNHTILESDVIENVSLTLEGRKTDLAHIYHTGLDYREMIRKAPSPKVMLEIRGIGSMKDYLEQNFARPTR